MAASTITRVLDGWRVRDSHQQRRQELGHLRQDRPDVRGRGQLRDLRIRRRREVDGVLEVSGFKENAPTVTISSNMLSVNMNTQNVVPFTFNANITTTTITNIPASGKYGRSSGT
jgi:hypothetical protein